MQLTEQIKRNQLAIISLTVALIALGYNTWRNELTEENRTIRKAGFEMLVHIGELQRITYLAHYDQDTIGGNPRKGWAEALLLKDLGKLMPIEAHMRTDDLLSAWEDNWARLGQDDAAVTAIDDALDKLREDLLATLAELD
jgi:hypothetical protein